MQLLAALALAFQTATPATRAPELRGEELMAALRSGGYTILLRHGRTDRTGAQEPQGTTPAERSAQRNLSDDGVRDARLIGAVLKKYQIPIGEIIASPMFRTRETAEMAAGTPTISMALRVFPSTAEQAALVVAAPKPGTNRLLVTHHFVIETHVPGIQPGAINESEAAVVRPTGDGKVTLVGRITLNDWERLGGVALTATSEESKPGAPAVIYSTVLRAETGGTPVKTIPNTRPGRLAERYLEAYNSGDATKLRAFVESSLVPDENRPTDVRVEALKKGFDERGPLSLVGVRLSTDDEIHLDVQGKGQSYILIVKASGDRATSITLGTFAGRHP